MGFICDVHRWRGISFERDLIHFKITLGLLTVMVCKYCVIDRLAEISRGLEEAKALLRRREEGR